MVLMHSNKREDIKAASTGDIIALIGLKATTTGDTLCDAKNPIVFEKMDFSEPLIGVACEPETQKRDEESNQTFIEGSHFPTCLP